MTTSGPRRPLDVLALPLRGSRLIEASAGTGKTWTIAALYLRLVLGHGDDATAFAEPLGPTRILVMTFTVAATRELSDRVRTRLVEAARCFRGDREVAQDDRFLVQLIAAYPDEAGRRRAAWRLATAAEAMDDAAVVTIDAWVQRMLREHAFDSGSVFDETLEPDQEAMLAEAVRDYWRQEIYPLRDQAFDEVTTLWPTIAALTDDVRRLLTRVEETDDDRSLARVRTDARAACRVELAALKAGWAARFEEMRGWLARELARKKLGSFDTARLRAKTVDGWLAALIAWADDPDRMDLGVSDTALIRLKPDGLREHARPGAALDLPPVFARFAGFERPAGIDGTVAAMRLHAARHVKRRIRALKDAAGIFGFQDQLERLDRALDGPGGERLRARIVEQHPVALIDEFQDTSPLQYRIFDRLYRIAADDPTTAVLLIGDPKQSIYGFRDADIHSYLRARAATRGRHEALTTNYRSTAGVVDAIDRLFASAEAWPEGAFRFGNGADRPLPFVPVTARGRDDVIVTADGPMPSLTIRHDAEILPKPDLLRRFAERCAEHVATSLGDARAGFLAADGGFHRLRPADIAVLVRDRHEAAAIRHALQRRRIASAYLSDQESVFASDEASDLLIWLRAVAEPFDARRARVAFATRLIGLSMDEMRDLASDEPTFERRVEQLRTLHRDWREQGVLTMLRRTLHLFDLPARWLREGRGERRLTNVLHLAELAQAASAGLDGEQALIRWLGDRLADVRRRSDEEVVRLESDDELVKVVTVHMAKGLEYSIVCLPFATSVREAQGKPNDVAWLPDADGARRLIFHLDAEVRARMQREAQQEEVRLLYVALTRARYALWLGVAPPRSSGSGGFHRSALGYLLTGGHEIDAQRIAGVLEERFAGLPSVDIAAVGGETAVTRLASDRAVAPLRAAPVYAGTFERDWAVGSFSSLARGLARLAIATIDPAIEAEILDGPVDEDDSVVVSSAARHRFPRGAFAGNFLHDQLEWLAEQRFALRDADVASQLAARCERQGWGHRADDVVEWLREVATTPLPPLGVALDELTTIVPEMEFWFPSERLDTARIDALCRAHLLDGRPRPPLPARTLRGMLMGFADLVVEVDGRYWVLDYKSNALGDDDRAYTPDALAVPMAAHRYDLQGAIYLLALHRLLRARLGARYDPARQLGGALYLFMRGIHAEGHGCYVLAPDIAFLDALDATMRDDEVTA